MAFIHHRAISSLHYSLPNLSPTNPVRRVRASEVRAQAAAIPAAIKKRPYYPHAFGNHEQLPFEQNSQPLIEHPLMPDGEMPWQEGQGRRAGPARIVVNEWDRSTPEVAYHDPTLPRARDRVTGRWRARPFSKGVYREREEFNF
ncbi:hypothetical protein C8A01DRAFT_40556 [Parachaetomium inaequale]|uniref:Uncharacterized protein n=1 Tax=Parachaetomium inaequale TaxID=2588326 RepID=A0AAN6P759_9PEZI|nr:hypothetical protein C8A01DRAFT_40556 [Parachaetomium inaequale]